MKKLLSGLMAIFALTGCIESNMMRAKGEQYCSDRNTSFYDITKTRDGYIMRCKNGYIIRCKNGITSMITDDQYDQITGPVAEEIIKKTKRRTRR